jgi:mono/diheme cytochrome c family protein
VSLARVYRFRPFDPPGSPRRWCEPPGLSPRWGERGDKPRGSLVLMAAVCLTLVLTSGCGRPDPADVPKRLNEITDFAELFGQRCAGCHGAEGRLGAGPPLNDPLVLGIIPDDVFRQVVTRGRPGTLMPPRGGQHWDSLTPEQIDIVVSGIHDHWGQGANEAAEGAPPYLAPKQPGDVSRGKALFAGICAHCHGAEGRGGDTAGPLHSPALLALVSDQFLRRTVIAGRPDLGMPDFRQLGAMGPAKAPLTSGQIADIVAYVTGWREPTMDPGAAPLVTGDTSP